MCWASLGFPQQRSAEWFGLLSEGKRKGHSHKFPTFQSPPWPGRHYPPGRISPYFFPQLLTKINPASWETQSFPSQVPKSLVAKEKLEDLIQRGEVVGLSLVPCPRQPLIGWRAGSG